MIVLDLQRITSIAINGTTLLSGVTYDPFGPATGFGLARSPFLFFHCGGSWRSSAY